MLGIRVRARCPRSCSVSVFAEPKLRCCGLFKPEDIGAQCRPPLPGAARLIVCYLPRAHLRFQKFARGPCATPKAARARRCRSTCNGMGVCEARISPPAVRGEAALRQPSAASRLTRLGLMDLSSCLCRFPLHICFARLLAAMAT